MSGLNKVTLIGRLGKDPEIRVTENGVKKATFSLATSEIYKDKEGKKVEQTEWHNILCWRAKADFAEQFLTKGKLVYLEGKLRTRSWEDQGIKKYITEIEVSNFMMLTTKSEETHRQTEVKVISSPQITEAIPESEEPVYDDLPF